jgi:hypothetical protein
MPRIFKKATNEWSTNRIVNFTITSQSNEKGAAAVTATPSISWRAIPDETGHPIKDARIGFAGAPHLKEFEQPPKSPLRWT